MFTPWAWYAWQSIAGGGLLALFVGAGVVVTTDEEVAVILVAFASWTTTESSVVNKSVNSESSESVTSSCNTGTPLLAAVIVTGAALGTMDGAMDGAFVNTIVGGSLVVNIRTNTAIPTKNANMPRTTIAMARRLRV